MQFFTCLGWWSSIGFSRQAVVTAQTWVLVIETHTHLWLVVWNMNFIFPYIGNNDPNWLSYFSEGWNHQPDLVGGSKHCWFLIIPSMGTDGNPHIQKHQAEVIPHHKLEAAWQMPWVPRCSSAMSWFFGIEWSPPCFGKPVLVTAGWWFGTWLWWLSNTFHLFGNSNPNWRFSEG